MGEDGIREGGRDETVGRPRDVSVLITVFLQYLALSNRPINIY